MRYSLCLLLCGLVSACDSPSVGFSNAVASRHVIGGNSFSVYVKGEQAQAIRTNFVKRPDIQAISRHAEIAIEAASSCSLTEVSGDVAVLTGTLDCSKPVQRNERATWVAPPRRGLSCIGESTASRWGDWQDVTLDCF